MSDTSEGVTNAIIGLNIGGIKYYTTRNTLLGQNMPHGSNNYFHGLLSGKFRSLKDVDGNYFIDRNGRLFEPILDYLRTGTWSCPSALDEARVLEECQFYAIEVPLFSDKALEETYITSTAHTYTAFVSTYASALLEAIRHTAQEQLCSFTRQTFKYPFNDKDSVFGRTYKKTFGFPSSHSEYCFKIASNEEDALRFLIFKYLPQKHALKLRLASDWRLTEENGSCFYYLEWFLEQKDRSDWNDSMKVTAEY